MLNTNPPYQFSEGACLLFDKPLNWTSFQLVKKIKHLTKAKTGHAGTLDPLATGLLILCTGKYTKKIEQLQGLPKTYTGAFKLGATTPSFDRETQEENQQHTLHIREQEILRTANQFLGEQLQIPPMYSALKQKGKKLYELAREGKTVTRPPRPITIFEFDILSVNHPFVSFKITCSKGTYIRSIASDFGTSLGVGAHLYSLRRINIGAYSIDNAWQIEDFENHVKKQENESV